MSPFTLTLASRSRRAALCAAIAACAVGGLAGEAAATQINGDISTFTVSDGIEAGQAPLNGPDVYQVEVAVVNGESVWKLTTDSPIRLIAGACTRISGANNVAGPSEVHCKRAAEPGESRAILGGGDDSFVAAPGFPDRLRLVGEDGNDTLTGGEADDVLNGGDGDNVLTGNGGNDSLTLGNPPRTQFANIPNGTNTMTGGPGNDFMFGADGNDAIDGGDGNDSLGGGRGIDVISGGEGDDSLNGTEDAFQKRDSLTGGGGTDQFTADILDQVFARDGIAERIGCKPVRFLTDPLAFAEVDLKDIIAFGDPCPVVLRAPKNETPSGAIRSSTVKVSSGVARVSVRCTTTKACTGTVRMRLARKGSTTVRATYRVAGKKTRTLSLKLRASDASKVTTKGVKATVTLTEKGKAGDKTVTRAVTAKR
ncbi:MAG: hypothetical protein JHC84_01990 [Solirubrobacteraceae bacterium]|nr:hypothetical protein [Solirubrobacteraceae bacterium]